jgi:hypothetical protein
MTWSCARRRLAALAAICALALQALWPLVAQARPRTPGILVPLCTVDGVTHYLELSTGKSPLEERSASHCDHCKFCAFGAERTVAVIPAQPVPLPRVECVAGKADATGTLPGESPQRLLARPRAPPAVA